MPAESEAFISKELDSVVPPAAESHTRAIAEPERVSEEPKVTMTVAQRDAEADRTDTGRFAAPMLEPMKDAVLAAEKHEAKQAAPKIEEKVEPPAAAKPEKPAAKEAKLDDAKTEPVKTESQRFAAVKVDSAKFDAVKVESKGESKDDLDASGISAEFFRAEEDSLPPMIEPQEHDHDERPAPIILSPAALARRARLRRVVAGVVAFAAVISLAVAGKAIAGSKKSPAKVAAVVPVEVAPKKEEAKAPAAMPAVEEKKVEEAKTAPAVATAADAKVADAKQDEAKPADAKADDKKADDKADEKKADPTVDVAALKKQALSLLNRGKDKDAIELCEQGIAAAPDEGSFYLYLGTAYQDLGKLKEAREAYNECVKNGKKGTTFECMQMGGHK